MNIQALFVALFVSVGLVVFANGNGNLVVETTFLPAECAIKSKNGDKLSISYIGEAKKVQL